MEHHKNSPSDFAEKYAGKFQSFCKLAANSYSSLADILIGTPEAVYNLYCRDL
jgi:hypothetical protein